MNPEFYGLAVGGATASAADASAEHVDIATGATPAARLVACTVLRAGAIVAPDQSFILNQGGPGIVRVGNGSGYEVTAGDILTVLVTEKPLV